MIYPIDADLLIKSPGGVRKASNLAGMGAVTTHIMAPRRRGRQSWSNTSRRLIHPSSIRDAQQAVWAEKNRMLRRQQHSGSRSSTSQSQVRRRRSDPSSEYWRRAFSAARYQTKRGGYHGFGSDVEEVVEHQEPLLSSDMKKGIVVLSVLGAFLLTR
jgi:hypothetical protein